jgi:hypothetical protein
MGAERGAIVRSGTVATDGPSGKMEENTRNAEALFESRKVSAIFMGHGA